MSTIVKKHQVILPETGQGRE